MAATATPTPVGLDVVRPTLPSAEVAPRSALRWRARGLTALECVVITFAVAVGAAMLTWPLGHDQGVFALNGSVVAAGGLPYRDAFETRGPLAFYLFALLRWIFGPTAWGVRVLDLAFVAATSALLYRVVAALGSRRAGRLTAATWPLVVATLGHQDSAQFELWIGAAVLACVLLVTRAAGYRARDLAAFGFVVGLATLVKPFYPVLLAVPGAVALLRRRWDVAALARDAGVLVVAWLVPVLAMVGWFWARGALADLWAIHILYSLRVYPAYGVQHALRSQLTLGFFLAGPFVPTAICAAAVGFGVLWREHRPLAVALAVWIACAVFFVELQGRFFWYHWTLLHPALAVLAAAGCLAVVRGAPGVGRWLGVAVAASIVGQAALTPYFQLRQTLRYMLHRQDEGQYYSRFKVWLVNPWDEIAAAQYVRGRTRPDEPIGMWAMDPAVPFLADRPVVSRFAERRIFAVAPDHPITRAYRREFLRAIVDRPPTYFVVNRNTDTEAGERPLGEEMPQLAALLQTTYAPDTTFGTLQILRRRDVGPRR